MRGRLQRATRWLRLALASLAVATGAVPAHAQVQAAPTADVALVVSPSAAEQRSVSPASARLSQRAVSAPTRFVPPRVPRVRIGVPEPPAPARLAKLFLTHRALLR